MRPVLAHNPVVNCRAAGIDRYAPEHRNMPKAPKAAQVGLLEMLGIAQDVEAQVGSGSGRPFEKPQDSSL